MDTLASSDGENTQKREVFVRLELEELEITQDGIEFFGKEKTQNLNVNKSV